MKATKITYYISTGLLTLMLVGGVFNYTLNYDFMYDSFTSLGYPTYLIYVIAVAKFLAIFGLWIPRIPKLREWAYAGLFYDFLLAVIAHLSVNHDEYILAIISIIVLFISYFSSSIVHRKKQCEII